MDKIMVAVDFTGCSDAAFERASELAAKLGAELDLVHVAPLPPTMPAEIVARTGTDGVPVEDAKRALEALRETASARGITARSHLMIGDVVYGLLDAIERTGATLVVVGTHGRGPIARALLGSVATSLCRKSPVPVTVVPSPARAAARPERKAWSCEDCGHILGDGESTDRCQGCGARPAHWRSAPITGERVDLDEPAVGEAPAETAGYERGDRCGDAAGLFATSPAGTEGYDVNPELRVRY